LGKTAKLNSLFYLQNGQTAKISSREMFENSPTAKIKINSREKFVFLTLNAYKLKKKQFQFKMLSLLCKTVTRSIRNFKVYYNDLFPNREN